MSKRMEWMVRQATKPQETAYEPWLGAVNKMSHKELDSQIGDSFVPLTLWAKREVMQDVVRHHRAGRVRKGTR